VELTGKLQVLKTLTWRDHAQPPSLSPDGRFVAYHDATSRETRPDIYILATDGSAEYRAEHPADDNKPIFAPDGSGVVFASDRRGIRDLWFLALKGGKPAGEPRLVWRNVGPFGLVQRFTESGSLLFYFAVNDVGVYTVPLDVNATETIGQPTRLAPLLNEGNSGAVFSPDGRYLSHFRADASRIVLRELATGVEREIPFGAPLRPGYANADWCSSSGTLIATGNIQGTGWVSYRVNVKDGSAQRLPISLPPVSPFFPVLCAADGDEIIYVPIAYPPGAPAAEPSIIRRSLATGRETTLFKGAVQMLARSMDGNRLAFVTIDPNADVARVVTMSATGGDISATVFTSGTYEYQGGRAPHIRDVVWMPGGDRLLLAVNESTASMALWEVPIMGSTSRKLGSLPLPKKGLFPGATRLSVHPDGKQFAFQSREGFVRQTWAIENLMQFIKAGGGK
jgi:hypothetical protein